MDALKTILGVFQDEILGMAWLNRLIGAMPTAASLKTRLKAAA